MAVKIRLKRIGAKKQPYYRVVVADSRSPRDGRFIEEIGFYNPGANNSPKEFRVQEEKVRDWMSKGAQPTETVRSLLEKNGVIEK
ncbi:MAG: 30S ribosomal protein S16 [Eubacteriales bacterium]|nr:30S ribosomal protein S16 [Eubacteriales bacterium]